MSTTFDAISPTRPERRPTAPSFVLAGYATATFWQRHRGWALALLGIIAFVYGAAFGLYGTFILMQLSIPLLVMLALIVWLLPDVGRAPERALDRLFFAFLAVMICWPNYLALALPGMPWITMIRLVAAPLAIFMLVCLSVSAEFRGRMKTILSASPLQWKALIAFIAISFMSIAVSRRFGISVNKFVVAQLYWTLIFFTAAFVFSRPEHARKFAYLIWICALVVALIGFWEWRRKLVPWAGHIPSFLKVDDEMLVKLLASNGRKATGIYRVKSVFTTALGLAEYLALSMPFVIHLAATARRWQMRVAAAASIPFFFYIITLTDSRLGAVGFFMAILFYILAWGALRWRDHRDSIIGPVVVLTYPALFCAFIAATFFVRRLSVMVWGGGASAPSSAARRAQVASGMPKIWSHPWGHGIGQGAETLHFANQGGVLSIDSYYLLVGLEYGVIGFIVWASLFLIAIFQAGRYILFARSEETLLLVPIVISLINFAIIKSIFAQESNHPLAFAMLGAVVALIYRIRAFELSLASARPANAPWWIPPPMAAAR